MPTLLVVDDEPSVLGVFSRVFREDGVEVVTATTAAAGLSGFAERNPDAVVLGVLLPDGCGLELFREIHQRDPKVPVILTTAGSESDTAIEATRLGAFDYLVKPLDYAEVRRLVGRAFEIGRLSGDPVSLGPEPGRLPAEADALVGRCLAMQAVYKSIGRVAPQTVTVLIQGESGTGKELVARAVYKHSNRAEGPFLVVTCAAIPETLLESELFGHERGAFTGADRCRIGKFEQSHGGTLFLDEIGDMSLALQSKILRVLQDQRFERLGGSQTIATDVRVIAATNRDLEGMVAQGSFRSDLYYRLNIYTIVLPPLRARREDLPLLIDHFLRRINRELGKQVRGVAPEATDLLERYPWPGNVRELQSVLKRAVLQTAGPVLLADFLPENLRAGDAGRRPLSPGSVTDWEQLVDRHWREGTDRLYDEAIALAERQVITRVLRRTAGNQLRAAKILGITRTTLRSKMRQLGISLERIVHVGERDDDA